MAEPVIVPFEPQTSFADALIAQVARLIADRGGTVREQRVMVVGPQGRIILPIVYEDGAGEAVAYIYEGHWDPVALEDLQIWLEVLAVSEHRGLRVDLWTAHPPPPQVVELLERRGRQGGGQAG